MIRKSPYRNYEYLCSAYASIKLMQAKLDAPARLKPLDRARVFTCGSRSASAFAAQLTAPRSPECIVITIIIVLLVIVVMVRIMVIIVVIVIIMIRIVVTAGSPLPTSQIVPSRSLEML